MVRTVCGVLLDLVRLLSIGVHSHTRLAAEKAFLLKQLALYVEPKARPRRANNATCLTLVTLARLIEWRPVLPIVQIH